MLKINQIIKDILLFNNSITIPGLGTFQTKYVSAKIDEKNKTIEPPTNEVIFNSNKKNNDQKLQNYLIKNHKLKEKEAEQLINEFISVTTKKLKSKANVVIDEVGILFLDDNGEINMKPIPSATLIESFGLNNIEMPPKTDPKKVQKNTRRKSRKNKVEKQQKKTKTSTQKKVAEAKTTENKRTKESNPEKNRKTIRTLLFLLPLVAIIVLSILYWNEIKTFTTDLVDKYANNEQLEPDNDTTESNNQIDTNLTNKPPIQDSTQNLNQQPTDEQLLKDAGFDHHITPIDIGVNNKRYYIIVGSFSNQVNAKSRIKEIKKRGFSAQLIQSTSAPYRVTIGGDDNVKNIIKLYNDYKTKAPDMELWLLKNEKN